MPNVGTSVHSIARWGVAQDLFSEAAGTERCRWVRDFDAAELHGVIGARFRDLARYDVRHAHHAHDHIRQALELRDPGKLRNRAFDLIGLTRTCLITRDPEQAAALIDDALPVARTWAAGRVGLKLADFHHESAGFASVPEVREVREAVREAISG